VPPKKKPREPLLSEATTAQLLKYLLGGKQTYVFCYKHRDAQHLEMHYGEDVYGSHDLASMAHAMLQSKADTLRDIDFEFEADDDDEGGEPWKSPK